VLDGRNRLKACRLAGVTPKFIQWHGHGSPVEWVVSMNLMRRHLSSSQRAVVALDLLPLLEKEAKDRQQFSRSIRQSSAKKCADQSHNGKASEVAARITRTNARYVEAAKSIQKQAPELLDQIRNGKVKIPEATALAKEPPSKRGRMLRDMENGSRKPVYGFRGAKGCVEDPRSNKVKTPAGVSQFLHDIISACCAPRVILDPCSGAGSLTKPWRRAKVIGFELDEGKDFLKHQGRIDCDLVLCTPPFNEVGTSRRFLPEVFLRKILEVAGPKARIVLFAPMGMRLNQAKKSLRWKWMRDECPAITSIVSLPLNAYSGVMFHSEILLFNMPKLQPHYFLPDRYVR
jgi:hypothetical protein